MTNPLSPDEMEVLRCIAGDVHRTSLSSKQIISAQDELFSNGFIEADPQNDLWWQTTDKGRAILAAQKENNV